MKAISETLKEIYNVMVAAHGQSPPSHWVTPQRYVRILEEMMTMQQFIATPPANRLDDLRLAGVPIKVVPFSDDPLFLQLRSMAALAGAEIRYQTYQNEVLGARFTTACGGWAYCPPHSCGMQDSHLYQIDEHGLPVNDPTIARLREELLQHTYRAAHV